MTHPISNNVGLQMVLPRQKSQKSLKISMVHAAGFEPAKGKATIENQ
ncbi:MAG: hypothetical protein ORN51_06205 [Akkermansiaceae bacterium]|nr:hypothetical protein [Akkermansiaceae bacterium]